MGRGRDPFDRTLEALRTRLSQPDAVAGAPLAVIPLAEALGVSPTPVREALARLSGEGLVVRTAGGYRALALDRSGLADRYALAESLALAVLTRRLPGAASPQDALSTMAPDPFAHLAAHAASRVLAQALLRVRAQLAPFAAAEAGLLGEADGEAIVQALAEGQPTRNISTLVRGYCRRRGRRAGEILGRTAGLS